MSKYIIAENLPNLFNRTWFAIFLLIGITLWVYWPAKDQEFLGYDDELYVTKNVYVQEGLTYNNFIRAFTSSTGSIWLPVTYLSHALDCQLYGLNPAGHKITNVAFHLINALLLFWVLHLLTGTLWGSAFVAALFCWHPLNLESVAWIAERKNLTSTMFGLLVIWAYAYYVKKPDIQRYLFITVIFILSMMSKPMLVTMPFLLLLLDYWPLQRYKNYIITIPEISSPPTARKKQDSKEVNHKKNLFFSPDMTLFLRDKIPLILIALGTSIIAVITQRDSAMYSFSTLPISIRIANALVAYCIYIIKMFWPTNLSLFYPYPTEMIPEWQIFLSALFLIAFSFFSIWKMRRLPYLFVGWFWFLVTLVPVIGLVQVGSQSMADRYAYIPLIGLFILITWSYIRIIRFLHIPRPLIIGLSSCILIGLSISTHIQLNYWHDRISIWKHALQSCNYENYIAHFQLGLAMFETGKLEESIYQYHKTIEQQPNFALAYYNLGHNLHAQGKIDEASKYFAKAVSLDANYYEARNNIGLTFMEQKKFDEAINYFSQALSINPKYAIAELNWGLSLYGQRKLDDAIVHFRKAIEIEPNFPDAHDKLGVVLNEQGKQEEALYHFRIAINNNSRYLKAYNNLGASLRDQGKYEEATSYFNKALEIDSNNTDAHNNLGYTLALRGKNEEAITYFRAALKIDPKFAKAYNNWGAVLVQQGKLQEAIAKFFKATEIDSTNAVAQINLGKWFDMQNKPVEAISHFRLALQGATDKTQAATIHHAIGNIFAKYHKYSEAVESYRQALSLQPNFLQAQTDLKTLLNHSGTVQKRGN